jgi:hypothetical protein
MKTCLAAVLALAAAGTAVAQTLPAFEDPPTLAASDVAPAALLRGPHHTVAESVPTDGWTTRFTIRSDFGTFEAPGRAMLKTRVEELDALARLDEISKTSVFAESAKKAATKPYRAVKAVVEDPVETAKGIPAGVGRFFKRTYRKGRKAVENAKDAKADADARERGENVPAAPGPDQGQSKGAVAGDAAKDIFGWNSARRQWARRLAIDPYTTNEPLSEKLDDVAWAAFSGGFAIGVAMPGLPGPVGTVQTASQLVWDLSPVDLEARNERALSLMGIEGRTVRDFFRNGWFTPTLQTRLVTALEALKGVAGRREVIVTAALAPSEEEAQFLVGAVEMLATLHEKDVPLERLAVDEGMVSGRDRTDAVVLPIPDDYVSWTEEIAGVFEAYAPARAKGVWLAGRLSPRAKDAAGALGFAVHEDVR